MMKYTIIFSLLLVATLSTASSADNFRRNPNINNHESEKLRKPVASSIKLEGKQSINTMNENFPKLDNWNGINDYEEEFYNKGRWLDHSWVDFDVSSKDEVHSSTQRPWKDFDPVPEIHRAKSGGRVKRQLIIQGTKWCGVGNVSRDNQEMGDLAPVDKCCREHDHCPYTIPGFRTKYNLYNFRFHTISHCECDDMFRTCLKMSGHQQADAVGELYFNMIGMKCFVFRREQVCAERAWWGRCERHKYQHTAETRDAVRY